MSNPAEVCRQNNVRSPVRTSWGFSQSTTSSVISTMPRPGVVNSKDVDELTHVDFRNPVNETAIAAADASMTFARLQRPRALRR